MDHARERVAASLLLDSLNDAVWQNGKKEEEDQVSAAPGAIRMVIVTDREMPSKIGETWSVIH